MYVCICTMATKYVKKIIKLTKVIKKIIKQANVNDKIILTLLK